MYLTPDEESKPKNDVDFTGDETKEELDAKINRINARLGRI